MKHLLLFFWGRQLKTFGMLFLGATLVGLAQKGLDTQRTELGALLSFLLWFLSFWVLSRQFLGTNHTWISSLPVSRIQLLMIQGLLAITAQIFSIVVALAHFVWILPSSTPRSTLTNRILPATTGASTPPPIPSAAVEQGAAFSWLELFSVGAEVLLVACLVLFFYPSLPSRQKQEQIRPPSQAKVYLYVGFVMLAYLALENAKSTGLYSIAVGGILLYFSAFTLGPVLRLGRTTQEKLFKGAKIAPLAYGVVALLLSAVDLASPNPANWEASMVFWGPRAGWSDDRVLQVFLNDPDSDWSRKFETKIRNMSPRPEVQRAILEKTSLKILKPSTYRLAAHFFSDDELLRPEFLAPAYVAAVDSKQSDGAVTLNSISRRISQVPGAIERLQTADNAYLRKWAEQAIQLRDRRGLASRPN